MPPKKKVKTEGSDGPAPAHASFREAVIEAAIEAKRKRKRLEEYELHKLPEEIARIWQKEKSFFMAQVESQGYTCYDFDIELRYFEFRPNIDQIAKALPSELAKLYKENAEVVGRRSYGSHPDGVVTVRQLPSDASPIRWKWNVTISFEEPVMRRWRQQWENSA